MKYLIWIFALIPSLLTGQGWERLYGGENDEQGYSVRQTTDGGYIILGSTKSFFGDWNRDMFLIKTDSIGDTTWTRTYGGNGTEVGYSVVQTTDQGYIITGETSSYGNGDSDVYLIKTDSIGDTTWTKTFGGVSLEIGYSVVQTTDQGYIIAGVTWSYSNGNNDVYVIRTNTTGDSIWTKTFGGTGVEAGYSVLQTTDGSFIIGGETSSFGNGKSDFYLIKTNYNGDSVWTKTYGGEYMDNGYSVQHTNEGGFILTGTCPYLIGNGNYNLCLIKTDSNGEEIWKKTHGGNSTEVGKSVQQTTDDGYIATGFTFSFGNGYSDVYLVKTDKNGNRLWSKTFGGETYDSGHSVQQTTDGGYIICGSYLSYGNSQEDIYLIKTDADGVITFIADFPIPNPNRKLIKTVDILGREISKPGKNQPYIEIYDDGTKKKKMNIR